MFLMKRKGILKDAAVIRTYFKHYLTADDITNNYEKTTPTLITLSWFDRLAYADEELDSL